jgi:erythromycin esterase-like protein
MVGVPCFSFLSVPFWSPASITRLLLDRRFLLGETAVLDSLWGLRLMHVPRFDARRLRILVALLLSAGALAGITPVVASASTVEASASTCVGWTGVQPPSPGTNSSLAGVAVLSPCNAWAVGYFYKGTANQTLIEHWNGTAWKQVTSPNPGGSSDNNFLYGVAATSSTNAWAVGYFLYNGTAYQTLIEHWNGRAWKQVTSPNAGGSSHSNVLDAVAATSSTNAWAVGYFYNGTADQTLIEHWNGTAWKQVTSPNPGGSSHNNFLEAVAATSSTNAWAVGYFLYNGTAYRTLIEHWNGTAWKQVTSPNPGGSSDSNFLNGVAATSSTNAWAVGYFYNGAADQTLIEHWNGTAWKQVTSPNPGGSSDNNNVLDAVAATSSTNAWAVGDYRYNGTYQTLIEHWNGRAWKQVTSPNPGGSDGNFLYGVAATSSTNAWAVGFFSNGTAYQTLATHCC